MRATVVFPTHGVPVIKITRLKFRHLPHLLADGIAEDKASKIFIALGCIIIFGLASWCVAFEPLCEA